MKVGTDGVILGAWAEAGEGSRALDIGTGTGLLALMLCQRFGNLELTALEIDREAAEQAAENSTGSQFSSRIRVLHTGFESYVRQTAFDLVICNPPYFHEQVFSPHPGRHRARSVAALTPEQLFGGVDNLLTPGGSFALIFPFIQEQGMLELAEKYSLYPNRRLEVIPSPGKEAKRVCLQLGRDKGMQENKKLIIEEGGRHVYSEAYRELTAAFYLDK